MSIDTCTYAFVARRPRDLSHLVQRCGSSISAKLAGSVAVRIYASVSFIFDTHRWLTRSLLCRYDTFFAHVMELNDRLDGLPFGEVRVMLADNCASF